MGEIAYFNPKSPAFQAGLFYFFAITTTKSTPKKECFCYLI